MTLTFARLPEIDPDLITAHMRDRRLRAHMPLLPDDWDDAATRAFVEAKEKTWELDGLGHWAFVEDGTYIGWGGFQKEGAEWDFGLVLQPDHFGAGHRIARACLARAAADPRIPFVTFLLPPSRTRLAALRRLGARELPDVTYAGETFRKFRLDTPG